jgi:hypothetical protein
MSEWEEAIFFCDPEVVSSVIFMVMCVDHDLGTKSIDELQESIPPVDESCIDQQSIDKKGVNLEEGNG